MSAARKVLEKIVYLYENEVNCIPSKFVRYREEFLGLMRSVYTIITASSGIGKSRFTKWAYMFTPFKYVKDNPDLNIRLKIFYFSLEENKDKFIRSVISSELYNRFGIEISARDLLSLNPDNKKITPDILSKIEEILPYVDELLEVVEVIDHIRTPYGIAKYIREYARQHGKFYFKGNEIDYVTNPNAVYDEYRPDDPDAYVGVIVDPINLLVPDSTCDSKTLFGAMHKFSSDYALTFRDKYGYNVVAVQQQAADKEKQEFTYKGQSIESKLEPSLDGLGDCKLTQRDADFVYALFAPDRYEMPEHKGYNIEILQDKYRRLKKLKDRDGEANSSIGLYFQGAVNEFSELPPAEDFRNGFANYSDYV